MDKLSKLQALEGEDQVSASGGADYSPWNYAKPTHLYEGTDSEDDEDIIRGRVEPPPSYWNSAGAGAPEEGMSDDHEAITSNEYQLTLGDSAAESESFCPWQTIKKYPYTYVGVANRSKVAEGFFDQGKLFERPWDFFYIHRHGSDKSLPAILLVPTTQLQAFLTTINRTLKTQLTIPSGGSNGVFQITFANNGTPRPRYLGRSTTRDMAENLRTAIPPNWFKAAGETAAVGTPSDRSLAAFKAKIDLMAQAAKGRRVVSKEKQKTERIAKQQSWNNSTKRVQRYLGIRQASHEKVPAAARASLVDSGLEWVAYHDALKATIPLPADFNPDKPAPYEQQGEIVFVCVDVEANERNASQITEIGVATLDTRDLKFLVPGERGVNWHSKIRARHFRISEYKHIVNTDFVTGCPDRFEFGESEFISLKDAPQVVASCFKPPFSNPDEKVVIDENEPKRNIILVGHGVRADISYLRSIGYDVHNLPNLQELVDTALMWQSLKRDVNPRNLGSVLAELDIVGWNLHNAGNDAVYTLQAMIGISIKQLYEREKRKEVREQEKKARVEESIKEAMHNALDREEGWSSGDENSDGGAPVAPVTPGTKKPFLQQPKKSSQYTKRPWRTPAQNAGSIPHGQTNDVSWTPAATSNSHPSESSGSWREQKAWERALGGTTPTTSVQSSNLGSRDILDLVKKTKLFTIESVEPAKENKPSGSEW